MTTYEWKQYLGSGVLILDTNTSSLLLVYDYTQNYNCCGGFIKHNLNDPERIEKTAREELYEETRMLISCELDQLIHCPFVDLDHHGDIFRCYILKISCDADICKQFENVDIETLPAEGEDYLETTSIAFFPIRQFRKKKSLASIDQNNEATGSDGKKYPLNRRVISVIKAAVQKNLI